MVWKSGEDAVLSRLDRDLQVRVWIEEHSFLQTKSLEVCRKLNILISILLV